MHETILFLVHFCFVVLPVVLLYTHRAATNEYAFLDEAKQGCTTKQLYLVHFCFVFLYGQRAATNEYASGKLANVNGRADDY